MESKARVLDLHKDFRTGKFQIVLEVDSINPAEDFKGEKRAILKPWREKRSLDANALFWHCVGKIAEAVKADKWEIYLKLLRRYGQYTYICVIPEAAERIKREWREAEEIGEIDINGRKAIQLLCYYGSSQYDTKEFSRLLDGTIEEMREIGIDTPAQEELGRALQLWTKKDGKGV